MYNQPVYDSLALKQVCASEAQDRTITGGDFNAHLPLLDPRRRPNAAAIRIVAVLETFAEIALLNTQAPTHVEGGGLDLTSAAATVVERIWWCVDGTITLPSLYM